MLSQIERLIRLIRSLNSETLSGSNRLEATYSVSTKLPQSQYVIETHKKESATQK